MNLPLVVRLEGNNVVAGKQTLAESGLKELVVTDTIPMSKEKKLDKIKVLGVDTVGAGRSAGAPVES